jgi:hypothetical protein
MNTRIHRAGDGSAASGSSDPAAPARDLCAEGPGRARCGQGRATVAARCAEAGRSARSSGWDGYVIYIAATPASTSPLSQTGAPGHRAWHRARTCACQPLPAIDGTQVDTMKPGQNGPLLGHRHDVSYHPMGCRTALRRTPTGRTDASQGQGDRVRQTSRHARSGAVSPPPYETDRGDAVMAG